MTKLTTKLLTVTGLAVALFISACATAPLYTAHVPASGGPVILGESNTIETVSIALPGNIQWKGVHKSVESYWTLEQAVKMSFHYGPGGCGEH
jgi:hypothetical protein